MPLRIIHEMVVSWVKFLVQTMEEKLSFGSSFKKHSFITITFGPAKEEAVNDTVYYIVPRSFLNDDVTFAQQHHGEALMIYAIGRRFLSLRIVVEVMCTPGVTPTSCELVKKSRVQECTSSFEKTPLFAKKWGTPAVGRSHSGPAGAHTWCVA